MPSSIFSEPPLVDDILNDLESDQTANFNTVYETLKRITKVSFVDQYETLLKVGQGTFGEVFKARNKNSKLFVAMKRIKTETEKEGFPVTAVREIRLLLSLKHDNVVSLKEVCCSSKMDDQMFRPQFYLVFEYCDHDLAGLNQSVEFQNPVKKTIMLQLLNGIFYLHRNNVIHRDLKAANILINKYGVLKIADFGLARTTIAPIHPDKPHRYTSRVVTLWYRPPEILLNDKHYGKAVDMWGAGCIMAELWTKYPIMQGDNEMSQLNLILNLCGPITPETWPGVERLDYYRTLNLRTDVRRHVRECLKDKVTSPSAIDLIDKLLIIDPSKRLTADEALAHDYFYEDPPPGDLKIFSREGTNYLEYFNSSHYQRHQRQQVQQQVSQMRHNQRPVPYGYNPAQGRLHDSQQRRPPNIPPEDIIHRDRIY